jgi:hypothetical protein
MCNTSFTTASAGDDPNYWMALTHQAEAQEFAVKVQNLLAELNKQNSKKVGSCLDVRYAINTRLMHSCKLHVALRRTALQKQVTSHTRLSCKNLHAFGSVVSRPLLPPLPLRNCCRRCCSRGISKAMAVMSRLHPQRPQQHLRS